MRTLMIIVELLVVATLIYVLINLLVFLVSALKRNFHPRDIIEKKAYDRLVFEKADTAKEVELRVSHCESSLDIATALGGRKILLGILVLLAANYLKKTSPP